MCKLPRQSTYGRKEAPHGVSLYHPVPLRVDDLTQHASAGPYGTQQSADSVTPGAPVLATGEFIWHEPWRRRRLCREKLSGATQTRASLDEEYPDRYLGHRSRLVRPYDPKPPAGGYRRRLDRPRGVPGPGSLSDCGRPRRTLLQYLCPQRGAETSANAGRIDDVVRSDRDAPSRANVAGRRRSGLCQI